MIAPRNQQLPTWCGGCGVSAPSYRSSTVTSPTALTCHDVVVGAGQAVAADIAQESGIVIGQGLHRTRVEFPLVVVVVAVVVVVVVVVVVGVVVVGGVSG